jgi:hypothetical protein
VGIRGLGELTSRWVSREQGTTEGGIVRLLSPESHSIICSPAVNLQLDKITLVMHVHALKGPHVR